jgi:hypothetical protein
MLTASSGSGKKVYWKPRPQSSALHLDLDRTVWRKAGGLLAVAVGDGVADPQEIAVLLEPLGVDRDADFTQKGVVSLSNLSRHIYLVTNEQGQFRLVTLGRPAIGGEMYGVLPPCRPVTAAS